MRQPFSLQLGFALLEVMIAALVLTVGAIAFMKLQTTGLQYSYNDYARGQGTALSRDFIDQLRSNIGYIALKETEKNNYILSGDITTPPKAPQEASTDCKATAPDTGCAEAVLNYYRYITSQKMEMITHPKRSILCYREHSKASGYIRVTYLWRDNSNNSDNTKDFSGKKDCPGTFDETIANENKRNNSVTIYAQL